MRQIVLASQSPRRRELLARILPDFHVVPTQADETLPEGLHARDCVRVLAQRKAEACPVSGALVIGADTVVVCDREILGKPKTEEQARAMLARLSGRSHMVYTGIAVADGAQALTDWEGTQVFFDELDEETIRRYVETGEPMDKAGAYGIQGLGALLVREIRGDYTNVVGLPLFKLSKLLRRCGVTIL